jgi:hypothetical protein
MHLRRWVVVLTAFLFSGLAYASDLSQVTIIVPEAPQASRTLARSALQAAGAQLLRRLSLTQSDVWAVPAAGYDTLQETLLRLGVAAQSIAPNNAEATLPTSHANMDPKQAAMLSVAKASLAAVNWCVVTLPSQEIMEYIFTQGKSAPSAVTSAITIALRADLKVRAAFRSLHPIDGGYAWHGVIEETGEPVTLLWRLPAQLSGQIYYHRHQYVLRHLGGEKFAIVEINPQQMPPEHPAMTQMRAMPSNEAAAIRGEVGEPSKKSVPAIAPSSPLDDAATPAWKEELAFAVPPPLPEAITRPLIIINVMVPYTAKAAAHYVDIKDELIDVAIEEANQSFINSGVTNIRLQLVYAYQTDYVETGTHFDHVFRLADKGDGYMEEVHGLRNHYHADVVVLIVADSNGCGLAAGVAPPADHAFAVVHFECAAASYSLAHEVGHLLGARHDVALDDTPKPYSYGHGFIFGEKWRTIMSYGEDCGNCPRLPIWSTPRVKVGGVPAGDLLADNARAIEEGATRVATFRSHLQ